MQPPSPPSPPAPPAPGAWLLDAQALHDEFDALWSDVDPGALGAGRRAWGSVGSRTPSEHDPIDILRTGNTWPLRNRALEVWSATDPVIVEHIARLELSTPDDWSLGFAEPQVGHWYRLCLAAHLRPVEPLSSIEELRAGLPDLGWSPVETRRVLRGRELGELAMTWGQSSYGPAVALALGHGQRGWLDAEDIAAIKHRLAEVDRAAFRHRQHLVPACEELWMLLDSIDGTPGQVLVLSTPP